MPNDSNANLQVQPGQTPGWSQVQASNNQWYSYQYTGGSDGAGGLEVTVGQGSTTLHVSLDTDSHRYSVSGVSLNDPSNQLTENHSTNNVNIIDKNDAQENGSYAITVADSQANNATIYCDPMIKNVPSGTPPTRT